MSARAAERRHERPFRPRMSLLWRSRLAQRIAASHIAVAAVVVALYLADPLGWDVPLVQVAGLGAAGLVAGALVGVRTAQQVASPISELLRALESREERDRTRKYPGVPADDIGRLSEAVGRLVSDLSDRVAANESFAADVAHEIRNPLASLRSAAGALRRTGEEHRGRLLEIIEQDVMRLDRLVSEISSASRLDAELVREEAAEFDLVVMVRRLTEHLSRQAASKGIEIIADLPEEPVHLSGLEARLAQVVVNVVENAISLCEEGDAIRIWTRRRDQSVLFVVEDTGPGIPEGAAEKIFRRFYSHRPAETSRVHSGLGLAISRQIVEAHGGMIWAENIRPTESDLLSEPLGARFAVVLPL